MKWIEAITAVLAKEGRPMHIDDIFKMIPKDVYRKDAKTPKKSLNRYLSTYIKIFRPLGKGVYELIDTSVTAPSSHKKAVGGVGSVVVRPCTSYAPSDPKYKPALDFVKGSSVLSPLEMELLELIVNFRLQLENGVVCFADILDKLDVEILEKEGIRPQSVDAGLLKKKLGELKEQIADMEAKAEHNNESGDKLSRMRSAAREAEKRLREASDGKIEFEIPPFGKFVSGNKESKPKVVIYLKSIEKSIRGIESRWSVMASVFVHEMFHAWNYFIAGGRKSVLAIDEPMVEFATLYFLKELKAFTSSQSHSLEGNMSCVKLHREFRVQNKQESIGDVAAYGFGYYLFKEFEKGNVDPIKWIETYSKKSASISHPYVEKVEKTLIPIYPFKSESKVMKWFKKIIFSGQATLATTGKSTDSKVGLSVSLQDLVLACIKTIGRKCFDAQELYAYAPIFKLFVPECHNLEIALKQELDELVKEGHLDALPNDCYSVKRD